MSGAQAGGSRGAGDKQALGEADAMRGELSHAAKVLRDLAQKMLTEGWDRLRGVRLVHAASQALASIEQQNWTELAGRAQTLNQMLTEFLREPPPPSRLAPVLRSAIAMAEMLEKGELSAHMDNDLLPAHPADWVFVILAEQLPNAEVLTSALAWAGFSVRCVADAAELATVSASGRDILLAAASWLAGEGTGTAGEAGSVLDAWRKPVGNGEFWAPAVLVGIVFEEDFLTEVRARQAGARLLVDARLPLSGLLTELSGLAWMPRRPYRIMIVDDHASVLAVHSALLRKSGCEVLAVSDPLAARRQLDTFLPEAVVLDIEMPQCRGTDLAALLRRLPRFAHLPVIYLSAHSEVSYHLDARHAGGEDYLTKPVDPRVLLTAVLARARQYRSKESLERQRQAALHELDRIKEALNAHAIVSSSAPDGSITDVNGRFCEISGFSREELIGRNHRIVKSGHHPASVFDEMWDTISKGHIWQGEVQNRHKSGHSYWVQATIVPILDEHGLPERYMSIRTEITAQKEALVERERRGRLLDVLRRVFQDFVITQDLGRAAAVLLEGLLDLSDSAYGFIGEILHDDEGQPYLKTHAITNIAWDEASQHLYEEAAARGMEFRNLKTLFGEGLRTGKVVFANMPSQDPRRGGLPPGHPPLNAFLAIPAYHGETFVGMVGLANRPGGYDASLVDFLTPFTTAYASMLEAARLRRIQHQVFDSLQRSRENAEDVSRSRAEWMAQWAMELRNLLSGLLGHTQIMLMNAHLDTDAREEAEAIQQDGQAFLRIIEGMAAQSQDNTLPPARAAAQARREGASQPGRSATLVERPRILVAEDNPANQAVLRMQLDVLGFDVDLAADGPTALEKWKRGGHVLLLADRNMPGMDGLALTRSIRAAEYELGTHLPILAITATTAGEDLSACRQAGMDEVLEKPIELDDLHAALKRWLPEGMQQASPDVRQTVVLTQASTVLDLAQLSRLLGQASAAQIRELVDLFTSAAHTDLAEARAAVGRKDARQLALLLHRQKSSARMVGAQRFAQLAEEAEGLAQEGRLDQAAALLQEMALGLERVEGALHTLPETVGVLPGRLGLPEGQQGKRVLVVDDDPVVRRQLAILLASIGLNEVTAVESGEVALELLRTQGVGRIGLLITDLNMPGMDGVEFLRHLGEMRYEGCLMIASGVDERLIHSAAELARGRGLRLRGTLRKPVSLGAFSALMQGGERQPVARSAPPVAMSVLPADILSGLEQDEFDVYFQPKVDATTLQVVGVEALARWQRQGRMIPPDQFITTAEACGLILPLSERLIGKALRGGAQLLRAGFPLSVAVNVSALWLSDIGLPELIASHLHEAGFPAEHLILEITETGVIGDAAVSLDVMTRLRLRGFKLSIDDFGTGYSSMEQLQRIPFGEMKLDRSFVHGATEVAEKRAILSSSVDMARRLKLSTVAEGVETEADLDLVRGLGCNLVQGWLIAKAMPVAELLVWLQAREANS